MNPLQFLWEGFRIAWQAINAKKTRSFLTTLGVAMGIFAITGILTMVNSMQTSVSQGLASLGNTTMFVHHFPWADRGDDWYKYFNRPKVSYKDYQRLKAQLRNVEGVTFDVTVRGQSAMAEGKEMSNITVTGSTEDFAVIGDLDLKEGRDFSQMEHHLGSAVCIVGSNVAKNLYGEDKSLIGERIRVGSKRLTIIGVMNPQGSSFFGPPSADEQVFMPYKMVARMFNMYQRNVEKVISIKASAYEQVDEVEAETIGIIRAARGLKPKTENNFSINKQETLMNQFDKVFGYLDIGGQVISIFSILIAVFSIGMIMYIAVRERTKEIGVQKALGSTRGFILYQFMTESLLICLAGGLLGLLLVFLIGKLITFFLTAMGLSMGVYFALGDMLLGIGLSLGIGLLSGIIPAGIAASLDPVIAIRQG